MLSAIRGASTLRWALFRIMSMVWILVSGGAARVHSAGLVSAQSSAAAKGDGAFRVQLVHLSPDFVNIILIACP
jgi:hypothetical protein